MKTKFIAAIPVLPSEDIARDAEWYEARMGFRKIFGDEMYCGLEREGIELHLQWHADTDDDPLLGGSVVRIMVDDVRPLFEEFVERQSVSREKLRLNTAWGTHEFGLYDLNRNAIFFFQDVPS